MSGRGPSRENWAAVRGVRPALASTGGDTENVDSAGRVVREGPLSANAYLKIAMLMSVVCVIVLFSLVYRLLELPAAVQSTVSLESATRAGASAGAATATATPTATAAPSTTGVSAIALQYPNVHSAPALGASVLGVLSRGTQVDVAGRSSDSAWLQIRYPDGPNGVGWVSTSLMSVNGSTASLPVATSP